MLKKVLMIAVCLLFVSVPAFAGGIGFLDIDAKAGSGDLDLDGKMIPNGGALGISGAIGCSKADADGFYC